MSYATYGFSVRLAHVLIVCSTCFAPASSALDASSCLRDRPDLAADLSTWGDTELETQQFKVLDTRNSLALLAKRASFIRVPAADDIAQLPDALKTDLLYLLQFLSGSPE
eukprot:1118841-Amphidinium_carterae.1